MCGRLERYFKSLVSAGQSTKWGGKEFGHEKDKLETLICVQIRDGKLDPQEAYDCITKDCVKFYFDEGPDQQN